MTHPIPSGTRDVLPDEMRELRAISERLRAVFDEAGYGEVYTPAPRQRILHALVARDFVGLEHEIAAAGLGGEEATLLLRVPQMRGGADVLDATDGPVADALAGMRAVRELLDPSASERVIFDLGLVRDLGYYTGGVFEVYDPALGVPIGGGGRYDDLLGRFGRELPAGGFAADLERLHLALTGEERT